MGAMIREDLTAIGMKVHILALEFTIPDLDFSEPAPFPDCRISLLQQFSPFLNIPFPIPVALPISNLSVSFYPVPLSLMLAVRLYSHLLSILVLVELQEMIRQNFCYLRP